MAKEAKITLIEEDFDDAQEFTDYGGEYLLRRWSWGQKNDAISQSTSLDSKMVNKVDTGKLNMLMVAFCLVKAPFDHNPDRPNIEKLRNLPNHIGDFLLQETAKINKAVTRKRKKA